MKTFFILSLPRSRSAWLANFLTYENSFCFHEALIDNDPIDLPELFKSTGKEIVGNSDCGNALFLDEILNTFQDTRLVIVHRPIDEVFMSLDKMGPLFSERENVMSAKNKIDVISKTCKHLSVDFHDMSVNVCKSIWGYCIGSEFDSQRWRMLDGISMEIIQEKKISQLEGFH